MILSISFLSHVLLVYARSIQRREILDLAIVERRFAFTLPNALKDLSAEHDVLGIVAKMEIAL
jgi:hypothetical protein